MKRTFTNFLIVPAIVAAIISIGIVGIQLIGASSDAAYGVQIVLYCAIVASLFRMTAQKNAYVIIITTILAAACGALMPFEIFFSMLQYSNASIVAVMSGEAYPDPNETASYWTAIAALFVAHAVLLSAAGVLIHLRQRGQQLGKINT